MLYPGLQTSPVGLPIPMPLAIKFPLRWHGQLGFGLSQLCVWAAKWGKSLELAILWLYSSQARRFSQTPFGRCTNIHIYQN